MKKRMCVCFFIFIVSVFHLSIPKVVFGQQSPADKVFNKYNETILREDVRPLLPDVLRAFGKMEIQNILKPSSIETIFNNPGFLVTVDPEIDYRFVGLLTKDNKFRTLFADEQFRTLLQTPSEIKKLVDVIVPIPTTLEKVSEEDQSGVSSTPLTEPFVVVVKDQHELPITGIEVIFSVTNGGGNFSGEMKITEKTDNLGRAEATLTLGPDPEVSHKVRASVVDFPSLTRTFTAAATTAECEILLPASPKATTLLIVSGYGQEEAPGTRLPRPFVVEVRDQYGKPFSGAKVVFRVTGGSLSPPMATTNSVGQAETTLTFGSVGLNSVSASVGGIPLKQTFTATAIAPDEPRKATTLSIVSGNNQSGESGMSLGQAFIVGVKDQSAKPLSGIRVTFGITAGRRSALDSTGRYR